MSTNVIGDLLPEYTMLLVRKINQKVIISWFEDDAQTVPKTDISGSQFKIYFGSVFAPIRALSAVASGNVTTWDITADDSDLVFIQYDGVITITKDGIDVPVVNLDIRMQPN